MICALTEVNFIRFFPFAFLYDFIDSFIIFRNTIVLIIVILQARKKLFVTTSEIIATAFETFRVDSHPEICCTSLHLQDYIAVAIYEVCKCLEFPDDFGDTNSPWNRKAFDMLRPIVHIIHRVFGTLAQDLPAGLQQRLMVGVV